MIKDDYLLTAGGLSRDWLRSPNLS